MIQHLSPYVFFFLAGLALALILTPLVRELNRRLGMVDKPDPRRINKVPIPRGGGMAVVIASLGAYFAVLPFTAIHLSPRTIPLAVLAIAMALIGYADDKFQISPRVKLLGQVLVAFLAWAWADVGFRDLWPNLPAYVDCVLTVFWICGAVNAFNLIDGLDGLASGLALIATLGMAGSLVFLGRSSAMIFHLAFAGALLGFLRYNYNPASVFLGDSGSMFIGFALATMPLCSHTPNSFLVSVGVPLLAMGVPIFDTSLAILRRTIRRFLRKETEGESVGNDRVMMPDVDHLHHRILRSVGLSQRKAAWTLYALALFAVCVGLVGMNIKSHKAGLWLAAVTVGAIVIFKDMARVEFYDAGRLLGALAHDRRAKIRRRIARFAVPTYLVVDILALFLVSLLACWVARRPVTRTILMVAIPIRIFSTFACLVFFRVYNTVWSRSQLSNHVRLVVACCLGAVIGTLGVYYAPSVSIFRIRSEAVVYMVFSAAALVLVRSLRDMVRDFFYALDCRIMQPRKDVSRIIVYGAGLRYRAFRRDLVRTASANTRVIVGLLDDDILLRGHYIGGIRILGTIHEAQAVINAVNADAVVIACDISNERLKVVREMLAPTGVKVTRFAFSETEVL